MEKIAIEPGSEIMLAVKSTFEHLFNECEELENEHGQNRTIYAVTMGILIQCMYTVCEPDGYEKFADTVFKTLKDNIVELRNKKESS